MRDSSSSLAQEATGNLQTQTSPWSLIYISFQSLFHTVKFSLQKQTGMIWSSVRSVLSHSQKQMLFQPADLQVENISAICRLKKTFIHSLRVFLQCRKAKVASQQEQLQAAFVNTGFLSNAVSNFLHRETICQ